MLDFGVYGYTLRDYFGKIVYVGISDNPRARRAEHGLAGKQFKEIKIETKPMSRLAAERWEARRLKSYRVDMGRNPRYNETADGGFGFMKSRPTTQRDLEWPRRSRRSARSRGSRTITQRDLDGRPW